MKTFLVVDDQAGWRKFNTQVLYSILGDDIDIDVACSASEAYNKVLENASSPYDCIITDMQMEDDYAPKHAGEWLIEQIKTIESYKNSRIIIVSASPMLEHIAENYGVFFIRKASAASSMNSYKELISK